MKTLTLIAEAILRGRAFAQGLASDHSSTFDHPMTSMARAHVMRSAVQAQVISGKAEGFSLVDSYLAFGKVEVIQAKTRRHYLLKARSTLHMEVSAQDPLFALELPPGAKPLLITAYKFVNEHMTLETVPVEKSKVNGRMRLLGELVYVGTWSSDDIPGVPPFDQGAADDFGDLSEDERLEGEDAE